MQRNYSVMVILLPLTGAPQRSLPNSIPPLVGDSLSDGVLPDLLLLADQQASFLLPVLHRRQVVIDVLSPHGGTQLLLFPPVNHLPENTGEECRLLVLTDGFFSRLRCFATGTTDMKLLPAKGIQDTLLLHRMGAGLPQPKSMLVSPKGKVTAIWEGSLLDGAAIRKAVTAVPKRSGKKKVKPIIKPFPNQTSE